MGTWGSVGIPGSDATETTAVGSLLELGISWYSFKGRQIQIVSFFTIYEARCSSSFKMAILKFNRLRGGLNSDHFNEILASFKPLLQYPLTKLLGRKQSETICVYCSANIYIYFSSLRTLTLCDNYSEKLKNIIFIFLWDDLKNF